MAVLLQLSEGMADRKGRGHDWIVRILHPPHAGDPIQDRRRGEQPHGCSRPRQRRRPGPGGARGPAMALPRTRRSAHWPRGEGWESSTKTCGGALSRLPEVLSVTILRPAFTAGLTGRDRVPLPPRGGGWVRGTNQAQPLGTRCRRLHGLIPPPARGRATSPARGEGPPGTGGYRQDFWGAA